MINTSLCFIILQMINSSEGPRVPDEYEKGSKTRLNPPNVEKGSKIDAKKPEKGCFWNEAEDDEGEISDDDGEY